jgi:hypothetical protein
VLYRLGRFDEGPRSDRALQLGTPDAATPLPASSPPRTNDAARATTYLRRALELNPHFDLLQAEAARTALAALEK